MTTDPRPTSLQEHPNAQLLRDVYAAFGAADRDRLAQLLADDALWHFPGSSPISGDWRGADGLLDGIRAVSTALARGRGGFELLTVLADDDTAMAVHRETWAGEGNHLDMRYSVVARIADGRVAEVWETPFDQAELERYFAVQAAAVARTLT